MHYSQKKFKADKDASPSRFLLDLNHFVYSEDEIFSIEKKKKDWKFWKKEKDFSREEKKIKSPGFFAFLSSIFPRKSEVSPLVANDKFLTGEDEERIEKQELEDIYDFEDEKEEEASSGEHFAVRFLKFFFFGFFLFGFFALVGRWFWKIFSLPWRHRPTPNLFSRIHPALYFLLFLFVLVLPLKGGAYILEMLDMKERVMGVSEVALASIKDAGELMQEMNFKQAEQEFDRAGRSFSAAQSEVAEISGLLTVLSVLPNKNLQLAQDAEYILAAGAKSTEIGVYLSIAMNSLSADKKNLRTIFESFYENGLKANDSLIGLQKNIAKIDSQNLPAEYQEKFLKIQEKTSSLNGNLNEFASILEGLRRFLGFEMDKRYLLVFQNNTEMRGSGGFIGSYAIVDFRNGEIKNMEIPTGGSYDTEAGLLDRIIAPEPLHLVNPMWHFWDVNWWPDWPKSAKKLATFLEKSNGPSVDGVISLTPTLMEDILRVMGPVDMTKDYGMVITAENFWELVQDVVENKRNPEEKPKKIVGDLMHQIISELPARMNKDLMLALTGVVLENLQEKQILFYFHDKFLEEKVHDYDWGGEMKEASSDYLLVANSNIAGGKSDRMIKEKIDHSARVLSDGSIVNELRITRTHTGEKRAEFTGVRNVDWMRVYVPLGSKLIEARGFSAPDEKYFEKPEGEYLVDVDVENGEGRAIIDTKSGSKIYEELGKTVFANWVMVDPGESVTVYLRYELPFKLSPVLNHGLLQKINNFLDTEEEYFFPYSLLVQKQPGSIGSEFTSDLMISSAYNNIWQYPEQENISPIGWQLGAVLSKDRYWAAVLSLKR